MQIQLFHSTHSLLKLFRLHFFTSRLNFYRTHFSEQPLQTHLTTTFEFGLFLLLNYSLVRHDFSLLHHSTSFFNFLYPTTSTSFRFFRSEFNGVQSEFDSERFQDIIETFQKTFGGVPSWTPAEFSRTLTEFNPNMATTLTYVTSTRQKSRKLDFPCEPKVCWTLREFSRVRSNYASEVFQDTIETFSDTLNHIPSWTPAEFSRTPTEFDQKLAPISRVSVSR